MCIILIGLTVLVACVLYILYRMYTFSKITYSFNWSKTHPLDNGECIELFIDCILTGEDILNILNNNTDIPEIKYLLETQVSFINDMNEALSKYTQTYRSVLFHNSHDGLLKITSTNNITQIYNIYISLLTRENIESIYIRERGVTYNYTHKNTIKKSS